MKPLNWLYFYLGMAAKTRGINRSVWRLAALAAQAAHEGTLGNAAREWKWPTAVEE